MAYDRYGRDRNYGRSSGRGRPPEDYDYEDRGFIDRAGDEVRSWFGDEEAERRRRWDARYEGRDYGYDGDYGYRADQGNRSDYGGRGAYGYRGEERSGRMNRGYGRSPSYGYGGSGGGGSAYDRWNREGRWGSRDEGYGAPAGRRAQGYGSYGSATNRYSGDDDHSDYRNWRDRQMEALDRDYDEYRRERQTKFGNEFHGWRQSRQQQRQHLSKAREGMDVVGSDGEHVGKVDHVDGDRLKLAKNDRDADGKHHYVPCSWLQTVEGNQVRLNITSEQAKQNWQGENNEEFSASRYLAYGVVGPY